MFFCPSCGHENAENARFCTSCGSNLKADASFNGQNQTQNSEPTSQEGQPFYQEQQPPYQGQQPPYQGYQQPPHGAGFNQPYNPNVPPGYEQKSKVIAGILNIVFGGLGIGRFYLGYTKIGVMQLLVSFITCGVGSIWGIIDGIMILTGNPSVDADGVPLKD